VLNGIGGRTIAEAQENMSYTEFLAWCRYRNKYGSLHLGMRVDRAFARVAAFFGNVFSSKKDLKPEDFSPMDKTIMEAKAVEDGSVDQVFSLLKNVARSKG